MNVPTLKENNLSTEIGKRIRETRVHKGFTQLELATRASMHRNHLGQVERGETNVTVQTVLRIARALGVTVVSILQDGGIQV